MLPVSVPEPGRMLNSDEKLRQTAASVSRSTCLDTGLAPFLTVHPRKGVDFQLKTSYSVMVSSISYTDSQQWFAGEAKHTNMTLYFTHRGEQIYPPNSQTPHDLSLEKKGSESSFSCNKFPLIQLLQKPNSRLHYRAQTWIEDTTRDARDQEIQELLLERTQNAPNLILTN